jgi:hypothetical protein
LLVKGRNISRSDRRFGSQVVRQQVAPLKKSLRHLEAEGFGYYDVKFFRAARGRK